VEKEMGGSAMKDVWVIDDALVSPLGTTSGVNFDALRNGLSGLHVSNGSFPSQKFPVGKIEDLHAPKGLSRFESICISALTQLVEKYSLPSDRTLFILSTTKGNIEFLENDQAGHPRIGLSVTAKFIGSHVGLSNSLVVSNACVSGVMALIVAKRFLSAGKYDHAVVLGADVLSEFVISGFECLHALSDENCRPFDLNRKGINLGEAAAAMLLSVNPGMLNIKPTIRIAGGGLSNDANHISGPSRTGEELSFAIDNALTQSLIKSSDVDFLSAHGTATLYNDEMESKAFALSGLQETPMHSLKSYYGHTLGAAGILETIMGVHSMKSETLIPTLGFESPGTTHTLNVITKVQNKTVTNFLKTASGFGGCNAALVLQKTN
jgi:3-oxoacyl-[acyl-carrier-protein] synthase I